MNERLLAYLVVLTFSIGFVAGCGGDATGPPTVTVSGVVTLDGAPLAQAAVAFSKTPEHVGRAQTDESGNFELKAEVGENRVTISKKEGGEAVDEEEDGLDTGDEGGTGADAESGELVPAEYSGGTGVPFTVPEGGTTEANFAITSSGS
jgi:hypothetical protein